MSIEAGAIATEGEHEQYFGIHSGGRNMSGSQALNGGVEGFAEKHKAISPQGSGNRGGETLSNPR